MRAVLAYAFCAGAALAQTPVERLETLPDFASCKDGEIAQFERDLARARSTSYQGLAPHLDVRGIDVCGVGGIILCDRTEAPLPCQHMLADKQEALRGQILQTLPAPEAAASTGGLYGAVWALAKGSSAGDDCAGATPVMQAWCEAREATRRVEMAVLAYQLAREGGDMASAFELGWAQVPAPVRPKAREAHTP